MQRIVAIHYLRFGKTYLARLQRSRNPRRSWFIDRWMIGCPGTSVRNYHYTLHNIPEGRRSLSHRGGSLKSRYIISIFFLHLLKSCCDLERAATEQWLLHCIPLHSYFMKISIGSVKCSITDHFVVYPTVSINRCGHHS
jgi:hypothetical protein